MKKSLTRILVSVVILAFVNFMFSNAIFTHVHKGVDGRPIAHSHPYLPSGNHGHASHSFDLVATFNAAAQSAQPFASIDIEVPAVAATILYIESGIFVETLHTISCALRGPPLRNSWPNL